MTLERVWSVWEVLVDVMVVLGIGAMRTVVRGVGAVAGRDPGPGTGGGAGRCVCPTADSGGEPAPRRHPCELTEPPLLLPE